MPEEIKVPVGKPAGMSDKAWIRLHQVVAKIYVNHSDEIVTKMNRKEAAV
ncbi:hypothetical protein ACFQ5D_18135 [Paenibacillus farraposensis]|uniref:Transposase n=1 Tax=Paenibacillus farraposensis TaxID=2807095 RepID=A0ABW4DH28_9BACL|nr:hypothetical protein [Paenibacillus farraposensis]MCC3381950.1 hypothetical protein [Paenibacillus farraposensis]